MESVKKRLNDLKNKIVVPVNDLLSNIPYNNNNNNNNSPIINDNDNTQNIENFQLDSNEKKESLVMDDNNNNFMKSNFKIITVQISDSILSISRKYNMSEESLVILNRLDSTVNNNLYPGQRLIVGSDMNIPLSNSLQNEIKDVLDYKLLLPRLRDKYDTVLFNKEVNTLDGYNDIQHYESELEKDKSRQTLYQLDNVIYQTDNDVELNGYITIKSETFSFVPTSLNFSFNKFEFIISSITAWNLALDNRVVEGEQVDSQRLKLRIWLDFYIDKSYMKLFQIHLEKTNNMDHDQNLVKELEDSLKLYFKQEMLLEVNEELIFKPPTPPTTSSLWDKYLSQPIPYYTSSNPLSKSNIAFSPISSNNNNNPNEISISPTDNLKPTIQITSPLSPLLSTIKTEEIFNYNLLYCFGENIKVNGILTLLPSRIIFQVDINDPIVKKEGSLKYQLHFTTDTILSCQLIPKINTFTTPNEDLQFNMDDPENVATSTGSISNNSSPILSLPTLSASTNSSSIHLVVIEQQSIDSIIEKDIIFESNENDINTIYKLIKEWMGQITPVVTPNVNSQNHRSININSPTQLLNNNKDIKQSISSNLFALSTSMVDKLFDMTTGISSSLGGDIGLPKYDDGEVYSIDEDEVDNYKIVSNFNPKFNHDANPSQLLFHEDDVRPLFFYLPALCQLHDWTLLYKTLQHGISMATLYSRTKEKGPCLLFIKDSNQNIFGAFIPESIKPILPKTYYGSGESFVFTLKPHFEIFLASKENQCFVQSTDQYFSIGGGDDGKYAVFIDGDLCGGSTYPCITFDSTALVSTEDFKILDIEIWGFE